MKQKESCNNTNYTSGFKITREKDGSFVAVKGEYKLRAKSAEEINELIKNFHEPLRIHDACVRTISEDLKKDNWLVKANIEGYEKPPAIGDRTPDVVAHKGCLKHVCEVVSEKDFESDKEKYRDFKNYCKEYSFQLYVHDKSGKPRPVDL